MNIGVGIDISKGKSTVCIASSDGEIIEMPFEVKHTIPELEEVEKKICLYDRNKIKILMEYTGQYSLPVHKYFRDRGYYVIMENPLKLKRMMDSTVRLAKTDRRDSIKLALCIINNWDKFKRMNKTSEIYERLHFLSRQYYVCKKNLIHQKVVFASLCDYLFPGCYELIKTNNYEFVVETFQKYYHPDLVLKKDRETFINEIEYEGILINHRIMAKKHAIRLYDLAQNTIPLYKNSRYLKMIAKSTTELVLLSFKNIEKITNEIIELAKRLPEYEIATKMPGSGEILGSLLIAEMGDVRRFSNVKQITAFAGLDTATYQSGKYTAENLHITKKGSKYLRNIGYQIISQLCNHYDSSNEIVSFVLKKESEGKHKKKAKTAGVNKLLKKYYGMVKKKYIELGIW